MADDVVSDAPPTVITAAAPPPRLDDKADPARIASYVRAAMHEDRTPGRLVVVLHPFRRFKLPRTLFSDLTAAGFEVIIVETQADRLASVAAIRDALVEARDPDVPLDLMCVAGDGTLDHHVLIGAFWAFYPDLVVPRAGEISVEEVPGAERARLPNSVRRVLDRGVDVDSFEPDEDTVKRIWQLRSELRSPLLRGETLERMASRVGLETVDPLLAVALLATALPHRVVLRPHGFDLEGLAAATSEQTFQGLYGFLRSITVYPAGTASDNAMYAGVPGWVYSQLARVVTRWSFLDPLRRLMERRTARRFLRYFTTASVVVPARFSMVSFDGDWQAVCSHAVGGPGSGRMFAGDIGGKSEGLSGYLLALPKLVWQEAVVGETMVHVQALDADGRVLTETRSNVGEGLFTNRTFIAGLGAVPSTDPTSFAGSSTFVLAQPILARQGDGRRELVLRGLGALLEGMAKGILGRVLHLVGIDPGALAGGGKLASLWPEHQLTLRDGEELRLQFMDRHGQPRVAPTQVSGDPYQAHQMGIRVAWGPLPLLASDRSLLLASTRRSLAHLRLQDTWKLDGVFIGGLWYFRHDAGAAFHQDFFESHGLFQPPLTIRRGLATVQQTLLSAWERQGIGPFTDTSHPGFQLDRRGRYAHNADQTAHLVILREARNSLLVRQVRAIEAGRIHETHTWYRAFGPSWVISETETRCWKEDERPVILQESHFCRSAETLRREAPAFFPFGQSVEEPEDEV